MIKRCCCNFPQVVLCASCRETKHPFGNLTEQCNNPYCLENSPRHQISPLKSMGRNCRLRSRWQHFASPYATEANVRCIPVKPDHFHIQSLKLSQIKCRIKCVMGFCVCAIIDDRAETINLLHLDLNPETLPCKLSALDSEPPGHLTNA